MLPSARRCAGGVRRCGTDARRLRPAVSAVADRGHRVLQHALRARTSMCTSPRGHRAASAGAPTSASNASQALRHRRVAVQFDRQIQRARRRCRAARRPASASGDCARQPQGEHARRARVERLRFEIATRHAILALDGGAARARDQPAQLRVAGLVSRTSSTSRKPSSSWNSLPTISLMPVIFDASSARTMPASEHSSVIASAS